jgi:hypothetical protein
MPLLYPLTPLSQDGFRSHDGSHADTTRPGTTGPHHRTDIRAARIDSMCNQPHTPSILGPLYEGPLL